MNKTMSSSSSFLRNLILPVYLPSIFFVVVNTACIILLPIYLLEQGYGVAVASLAATMRGVGSVCINLPGGIIANRIGDKPSMLLGVSIGLVATLMLVLFDSEFAVLLAAMLLGSSSGLYMIGRLSFITDVCRPDQRARAISVIAGMQRFGSLVSPLLFSLLARVAGYQLVFMVMVVLIVVNIVLMLLFADSIPSPHRQQARIRDMFGMAREFRRVFMTAGMVGLTLMALRTGRQILFPIAGYAAGMDGVQISTLYAVSMLLDFSLTYPAGAVMDRYGRKVGSVPGMVLLSLSLLCIAVLPGMWGMMSFTVLSGVGNGLTTGILLTLASDYAPDAQRNQFIGIWRTQADLGMMAAPAAVGALAESASLAAAAAAVAAVGIAGTLMLIFTIRETLVKEPPDI